MTGMGREDKLFYIILCLTLYAAGTFTGAVLIIWVVYFQ